MTMCVLLNSNAGSAEQATALHAALAKRADVTLLEPVSSEHTRELAASLLAGRHDLIIAAGGDGTVNAVVNGLAEDLERLTTIRFGIIPLGTGNDFARTLALPTDPVAAFDLLAHGSDRPVDLIEVSTPDQTLFCANVCSGGFAGQMQEAVTKDAKQFWGSLAYLFTAVRVLPDLCDYHTTLWLDDEPAETLTAFNIIVANGRTAAGGYQVAGRANPEDGMLDLVIVPYGPLLDLTTVAAQVLTGDYLDGSQVHFRRGRRLRIESTPPLTFSVDGEVITSKSITFTVHPHAVRTIVGPDYRADPVTPPSTP